MKKLVILVCAGLCALVAAKADAAVFKAGWLARAESKVNEGFANDTLVAAKRSTWPREVARKFDGLDASVTSVYSLTVEGNKIFVLRADDLAQVLVYDSTGILLATGGISMDFDNIAVWTPETYRCRGPVACEILPPRCEPGYQVSVPGICYGACVPAFACQ
jgi:hypothetical protein